MRAPGNPPQLGEAGAALEHAPPWRHPSRLVAVSLVTAGWGLLYAIYRGYDGLGGTVGMFGTPTSATQWRAINLVAAAILLVAAVLPVAALAAIAVLTSTGLLSAFDVIGKIVIA